MFVAMGHTTVDLESMTRNFEAWVARKLAEGTYLGWITFDGESPVASVGLLLLDWPPIPFDPAGVLRGYLLNVFVEAEYRRRGLARSLLQISLDESRRRGIRCVSLHASEEGRSLYQALGFTASNEMCRTHLES